MFVTPTGQLTSSEYSWSLGDLAADTEYLLQVRVTFDQGTTDLQGGLHEVRTLPLPTREWWGGCLEGEGAGLGLDQ